MTTLNLAGLTRKITLGLGALVVSTVAISSAADAKANIQIHLGFGHGYHGPYYGGWYGPNCWFYWHKYKKTGKWYWKKKFYQCKASYW